MLNDLLIRYEERCNYQPLPLFGPGFASEFFRTFESRDDELVTALLAIAFRIFHGREDAVGADVSDNYAARANDLVTRRLSTGGVNLATIQALCLLSFWEFTGNFSTTILLQFTDSRSRPERALVASLESYPQPCPRVQTR